MTFLLLDAFVIGASLGYIAGMMTAWRAFVRTIKAAVEDVTKPKKGPWG